MEIRARYILIGLFTILVILAVFGFVYWLETTGGLGKRTSYEVRFRNTVSGLLSGLRRPLQWYSRWRGNRSQAGAG